jgi:hypothetical protein
VEESPDRGSHIGLGYFLEKKYLRSPSQRDRNENCPLLNERATGNEVFPTREATKYG